MFSGFEPRFTRGLRTTRSAASRRWNRPKGRPHPDAQTDPVGDVAGKKVSPRTTDRAADTPRCGFGGMCLETSHSIGLEEAAYPDVEASSFKRMSASVGPAAGVRGPPCAAHPLCKVPAQRYSGPGTNAL